MTLADFHSLGSVTYKVKHSATDGAAQTKFSELQHQFGWNSGVKGRAVVNQQHPDIGVFLFKMSKRSM